MVLYIIMILEGLMFFYSYLSYRGIVPFLELLNISNNYIRMAKGVLIPFSPIFGLLLLIVGVVFLYMRIKKDDNIIDKDNIFPQMTGLTVFFGVLLFVAYI